MTHSLMHSGVQSSTISSEYAQEAGASFTSLSSLLIRNTRRGESITTLHEIPDECSLVGVITGVVKAFFFAISVHGNKVEAVIEYILNGGLKTLIKLCIDN